MPLNKETTPNLEPNWTKKSLDQDSHVELKLWMTNNSMIGWLIYINGMSTLLGPLYAESLYFYI